MTRRLDGTSPPAGRPQIGHAEWAAAVIAMAIALFLHLVFFLFAGPLWRDEAHTLAMASTPTLKELWAALEHTSAPLGAVLPLRLWIAVVPATDVGLRAFGASVGLVFLATVWIGTRLLGANLPLISLALLGLNPVVVRYVDCLRPYGLGTIFVLMLYGLVRLVIESPTRGRWVLATLLAVLAVQTLYTNALLVGAICCGGAAIAWRRAGWIAAARIVAIGAVAALSLGPYRGVALRSWRSLAAARTPDASSTAWEVVHRTLGPGGSFVTLTWIVLVAGCLLAAVAVHAAGRARRMPREKGATALYCAIVGATVLALFSVFFGWSDFETRPWHCLPPMAIVATSIEGIVAGVAGGSRGRWVRLAVVALVAAGTTGSSVRALHVRQTNVDLCAALLEKEAVREDLVVVSPWYFGVSFRRYYRGNAPWVSNPPLADLGIHRYDLLMEQMASDRPIESLVTAIEERLRSGATVWFVGALRFSKPGERGPIRPPAPDPVTGWYSAPFLRDWMIQVGDFVRSHATDRRLVPLQFEGPVSDLEQLRVFAARGWRDLR